MYEYIISPSTVFKRIADGGGSVGTQFVELNFKTSTSEQVLFFHARG